jgi:hypothetical protein
MDSASLGVCECEVNLLTVISVLKEDMSHRVTQFYVDKACYWFSLYFALFFTYKRRYI